MPLKQFYPKYLAMHNTPNLHIIKAGGVLFNDSISQDTFLHDFANLSGKKILVHGGGLQANQLLNRLGISPVKIEGRRITDQETLEAVTWSYAGLNKKIVAQLQSFGCKTLGLSGADGAAIQAHKREVKEIDYGFAGDIDHINLSSIIPLLQIKYALVFCPLTYDPNGTLLNTNADTIATQLAISLSKQFTVRLQFVGDTPGVFKDFQDPNSILSSLTLAEYESLKESGQIADGMIPKLDNAFAGLDAGIDSICINNQIQTAEKTVSGTNIAL